MKQLLEQLQQYPETWERFKKHCDSINCGFYIRRFEAIFADTLLNETGKTAIYTRLLTDFCDGEGYYLGIKVYYISKEIGFKWEYRITNIE